MEFVHRPRYLVELFQKVPGRNELRASWQLNHMTQCQISNSTSSNLGAATVTLLDKDSTIERAVRPAPMDVIRVWSNSRVTRPSFAGTLHAGLWPAFTGFVDSAQADADPQGGVTMTISATVPYKLWETTLLQLSPPQGPQTIGTVNDATVLAQAYIRGISGRNLLLFTAQRVGYQPGFLQVIDGDPALQGRVSFANGIGGVDPEFVGQYSMNVPMPPYMNPDLQTYSSVVQSVVADTGNELFCDAVGNVVYRPMAYLDVPPLVRQIVPEEIFTLAMATSDQGVITAVRVRWYFDTYNQGYDGYWEAPAGMIQALGYRAYVIEAPWIVSQNMANYLAAAVGQQLAGTVGGAVVSMVSDPAIKLGTVVAVPSVYGSTHSRASLAGEYSLGYVTGLTHAWQTHGTWVTTLTLQYLRSPGLKMAFAGRLTMPILNTNQTDDPNIQQQLLIANATGGISTANASAFGIPAGLLSQSAAGVVLYSLPLDNNSKVPDSHTVWSDPENNLANGTIIKLQDPTTHAYLGNSPTGEYTVVNKPGTPSGHLQINASGLPKAADVLIVKYGRTQGAGDTSGGVTTQGTTSQNTPGSSSDSNAGSSTTLPNNPPATNAGGPSGPGGTFAAWPFSWSGASPPISQGFGAHSGATETYYGKPFHTGIDYAVPSGTPLYAPDQAVIIQGPITVPGFGTFSTGLDPSADGGYGYLVLVQVDQYVLFYGHTQAPGPTQPIGSGVSAGAPIAYSDNTGNSTGPHLHFGVFNLATNQFVDPSSMFTATSRH